MDDASEALPGIPDPAVPEEPPVLAEHVPVLMPELPAQLVINTTQQYKAITDPTRSRILGIIRHLPATAKQIADRLGIAPGTSSHHLQVLEAAGLAKVVARRMVRGIVAKYYTRTARIFIYDIPPEDTDNTSAALDIANTARNELLDTCADYRRRHPDPLEPDMDEKPGHIGFPHARISLARAEAYRQRVEALINEFNDEPTDPDGIVYGLLVCLFPSPDYMQVRRDDAPHRDREKGA